MANDERKIIIDEDWKAQVQREREQVRQQQTQQDQAAPEPSPGPAGAAAADPGTADPGTANQEAVDEVFMGLIGSLATQAMYALGAVAQEGQSQVMVDLDQARYVLDTLMTLRKKTKGNLAVQEEGQLNEAISELQRLYVLRDQQVQQAALRKAGVDPAKPPGMPRNP